MQTPIARGADAVSNTGSRTQGAPPLAVENIYAIPKVFASLVGAITLALVLTFVVGKIEQLLTPWRRAG